MHPKVSQAIQEIDAALMNGDTFDDADDRAELRTYLASWRHHLDTAYEGQDTVEPPMFCDFDGLRLGLRCGRCKVCLG